MGAPTTVGRALGIPTDVLDAAQLAVHGVARPVDVLEARLPERTVRAVEGVSAGFQAAARGRYRAHNSGAVIAGSVALARTLLELPRFSARVSFDREPARQLRFEQMFLNTLPYFAFRASGRSGRRPRRRSRRGDHASRRYPSGSDRRAVGDAQWTARHAIGHRDPVVAPRRDPRSGPAHCRRRAAGHDDGPA